MIYMSANQISKKNLIVASNFSRWAQIKFRNNLYEYKQFPPPRCMETCIKYEYFVKSLSILAFAILYKIGGGWVSRLRKWQLRVIFEKGMIVLQSNWKSREKITKSSGAHGKSYWKISSFFLLLCFLLMSEINYTRRSCRSSSRSIKFLFFFTPQFHNFISNN